MPQLDLYTWFIQVIWLILVLFVFYYVMSFHFLILSMRLFKIRTKILDYRQLVAKVLTCQANVWILDLISLSLGVISSKFYALTIMRQAASKGLIKEWIFKSTPIAVNLELILVVYELCAIMNTLKVTANSTKN